MRLKTKFRNVPTTVKNKWFASKLEASRFQELERLKASGDVRFFLRQVPFDLVAGVRYVCDFIVFWKAGADGSNLVTIEDCKGKITTESKNKIRMVEELYQVQVQIITKDTPTSERNMCEH